MIVVFGSINLDLIYRVDSMPQPGQTILAHTMTTEPGGKGANQAVAAALDSAYVAMIGMVGDDALATTALAGLRAAGVDLSGVGTTDCPTGSACIAIDVGGQNQIIVAAGANTATRRDQVHEAVLTPGTILLTQMETDLAQTAMLIRDAHEKGLRCIHNLAPAGPLEADALRLLDVLVVNEEEGEWLARHLGGTTGDAATLHELLGVTVVRTLGADGVEWAEGGVRHHRPAPVITPVDTTAAGDCFVGVLAATLDRGATLEAAIARAGIAAPIACTREGSQRSLPMSAEIDGAATDPL
jgi:ribokinase